LCFDLLGLSKQKVQLALADRHNILDADAHAAELE
jgi:hypothetical protein